MATQQSVRAAQQIAATFGETWTTAKINQVATQLDRGQRTPTGVIQDIEARGGQRVGSPSIPATGNRTGADGGSQIIMVDPNGTTTVVGPNEVEALLASGWRWPTEQQQAAVNTTAPTAAATSGESEAARREREAREEANRAAAQAAGSTTESLFRALGLEDAIALIPTYIAEFGANAGVILEARFYDPATDIGRIVDRLYPELRQRRDAGKNPMSIPQIQSYYQQGTQMLQAAGLDRVMDVRAFLSGRLVGNVNLNQIAARIQDVEDEAARVFDDPEAAAELEAYQRFYNVSLSPRDLVAFALDFDKADAEIRRAQRAVGLDVQAGRAGFGDLSRSEAERLADVGISDQAAVQGFGFLSDSQGLFNPLVGTAEDQITRQEQLAGVFEGNANARRRIERRAQERKAAFAGGGSYASDREGFSGIGSAR